MTVEIRLKSYFNRQHGANNNNGLENYTVFTGLNVHIYRAITAKTHIFVFHLNAL